MEQLYKMQNLKGTANENDRLEEGYCLMLDNEVFHVFVMYELTNSQRGYVLKIMYQNGTDNDVNLDDSSRFPEVNAIFGKYCRGLWKNKGTTRFCYKYVVFGLGDSNKLFSITIMRQIVCDILMSATIE